MSKEKRLQSKVEEEVGQVSAQENFVEELVQSITEREFVNHAELRDKISEAEAALGILEDRWAKAEEARDKLEKLQGKRKEVR